MLVRREKHAIPQYYFIRSMRSANASLGDCPLSLVACVAPLRFSAGVCQSELHPRGLKATRIPGADSGARLVKLMGGVSFKASTQPITQHASIRGGSPEQDITNRLV